MSNLSAFMHANVEQIENYKFAASPRFKGEDGKPMLWEICCISADEYARIRNSCVRQVPVPGKKSRSSAPAPWEAIAASRLLYAPQNIAISDTSTISPPIFST